MTTVAIYPDNFLNIYTVASVVLSVSALFWGIKKAINLINK